MEDLPSVKPLRREPIEPPKTEMSGDLCDPNQILTPEQLAERNRALSLIAERGCPIVIDEHLL